MTRTEERLRDALSASAGRVRDERLRPLPTLEAKPRRHTQRTHTQRTHTAWLAPVAAALSVLLIVALAVTLTGGGHEKAPSAGYRPLPAGFPKYFAQFAAQAGPDFVIRSTSTGAEVTPVMVPDVPG